MDCILVPVADVSGAARHFKFSLAIFHAEFEIAGIFRSVLKLLDSMAVLIIIEPFPDELFAGVMGVDSEAVGLVSQEPALVLVSVRMVEGAGAMSSSIPPLAVILGSVLPNLNALAMLDEDFLTPVHFGKQLTCISSAV